jgi:8-oxo-dGTP pyrophosphatase MutT (NUDIX family)
MIFLMNARGHPAKLGPDWLRQRFSAELPYEPVTAGDGHLFRPDGVIRPASVLVPVVNREAGLTVLLTRRTAHLHDHAGQISLPGGRSEGNESAEETALRETAEEIGLHPRHVELLGSLTDYVTVTGYRVTPVVGLVSPPFDLQPDTFEVAEIFEVPLTIFLDPANHQRNRVVTEGVERQYYAMPYGPYYIWGATAGMLMNLYRFLTR